jgi:hypothetical protein
LVISHASIHFENLSTATSRCMLPLGAFLRGLTRSSPHTTNGHVIRIVWSAWAGKWVYRV